MISLGFSSSTASEDDLLHLVFETLLLFVDRGELMLGHLLHAWIGCGKSHSLRFVGGELLV